MILTEIGRPQISGRYPYKVLNSQWVPTKPEAMQKTKIIKRHEHVNVTSLQMYTSNKTDVPLDNGL